MTEDLSPPKCLQHCHSHGARDFPLTNLIQGIPLSFPDGVPSVFAANSARSQQQFVQAPRHAPLGALSAYNFFFRDERERILNGGHLKLTPAKQHKLLQEHWGRDRTKKRRHRKTHGKVDFKTLSKMVSHGWKSLHEDFKAFYREVAARDWKRYQSELEQQKNAEIAADADSSAVSFSSGIGSHSFSMELSLERSNAHRNNTLYGRISSREQK